MRLGIIFSWMFIHIDGLSGKKLPLEGFYNEMFYQQMYIHDVTLLIFFMFNYFGHTVYFGGETGSEGLITSGIVWDAKDKKIHDASFCFLIF